MGTGIVAAIGSLFLIVIGLWKHFGRKAEYKRKMAEDAQKKVNDGVDSGNTSDITSGFDGMR